MVADPGVLWQLAGYFGQAGAFVFGSGLAIVPFLYGGVVGTYGWLTDRQFLDAVAVALLTPGPVVITIGFIGYLVAGLPGAVVAAVATFLPCYDICSPSSRPRGFAASAGGTEGIVTIEDLLEELVGEIYDEFAPTSPAPITNRTAPWSCPGRSPYTTSPTSEWSSRRGRT